MELADVTLPIPEDGTLVWVTITVGVIVTLATAFPKIVGPLAQGWERLTDSLRRTSSANVDSDIADMTRQIKYFGHIIEQLRHHEAQHDRYLAAHAAWDVVVRNKSAEHGIILPAAPPLWPGCDVLEPPPHTIHQDREREKYDE